MKKEMGTDLHKQDDWSRRRFIQNVGLVLGVFGVPSSEKFELMERISRKIFGSSTAFSAVGPKTLNVMLCFRAGFPQQSLFPNLRDAPGNGLLTNRNFHAVPNSARSVQVSGAPVATIFAPQLSDIATRHGNRIVVLGGFSSNNQHSNIHPANGIAGSDGIPVAHAAQSTSSRILPGGAVFGTRNAVDLTMRRSSTLSKYAPVYYSNFANFRNQFTAFQIKGGGNTTLSKVLTDKVTAILTSKFDTEVIEKIRRNSPEKAAAAQNNTDQLARLLSADLQALLVPNAQDRTDFGIDVVRPNGTQFDSNNLNLGEFLFLVGKAAELGITEEFALTIDTFDWHQRHASQGMANAGTIGPDGTGSQQAVHAAYFNRLVSGALDRYGQMNSLFSGNTVMEDIVISLTSEFDRSCRDGTSVAGIGGDNGDNDNQRLTLIAHENRIVGGTRAQHDTNLNMQRYDGASNQFLNGDGDPNVMPSTLMKVLGINATTAGVSAVANMIMPGVSKL